MKRTGDASPSTRTFLGTLFGARVAPPDPPSKILNVHVRARAREREREAESYIANPIGAKNGLLYRWLSGKNETCRRSESLFSLSLSLSLSQRNDLYTGRINGQNGPVFVSFAKQSAKMIAR